jgi:hypothetical protein
MPDVGSTYRGYCNMCGEWSEKLNRTNGRCTKCSTKAHSKWTSEKRDNVEKLYKDWLEDIRRIPAPHMPLTENQWLEACRHFKGTCAYCGTPEIASRSMFIPFKKGGRYCVWNVIPACERCETAWKAVENPFSRMNRQLNRDKDNQARKYNFTAERLQAIVDYLEDKKKLYLRGGEQ